MGTGGRGAGPRPLGGCVLHPTPEVPPECAGLFRVRVIIIPGTNDRFFMSMMWGSLTALMGWPRVSVDQ